MIHIKILLSIFLLGLIGCANPYALKGDWPDEALMPGGFFSERILNKVSPRWNVWLGKTKDERIRELGLPDRCAVLTTGEEVCEWRKLGVNWEHKLSFIYDGQRIAREWSYSGSWGQQTSREPVRPAFPAAAPAQ